MAPDLHTVPEQLSVYLDRWQATVHDRTLVLLGRGSSLAAARAGALAIKETARVPAEGMSGGAFRHGPLELADDGLTAVILAGDGTDLELNRRLAADIECCGAQVAWIGSEAGTGSLFPLPSQVPPAARPIAEILPLQLLSLALAERAGLEPRQVRDVCTVTRTLCGRRRRTGGSACG